MGSEKKTIHLARDLWHAIHPDHVHFSCEFFLSFKPGFHCDKLIHNPHRHQAMQVKKQSVKHAKPHREPLLSLLAPSIFNKDGVTACADVAVKNRL